MSIRSCWHLKGRPILSAAMILKQNRIKTELDGMFLSAVSYTHLIYFVYTGVNNTGVPYKLTANVSGAISFMQSDRSEYSTLIGQVREARLPDRVGNALIKVNQELINFQKAMYEPGENDKEREMALKAEAEGMTRAWKGKPALRIPVLPESISVKSMADRCV